MALNFPSSPSVGDVYQRWTWNGVGWAPTPSVVAPMLPIAGGTITGNLAVQGTTALTGTLTAAGASNLNTLDVNGQATFADGVEIDGEEAATRPWVDEQIAAGSLWQGTWDAANNDPDLTNTGLQTNGFTWAVTLADPTAPFEIPATPVIPGLNGLTVYNGDHVIWSTSASEFQIVPGSSISLQEAQDMFLPFTGGEIDAANGVPRSDGALIVRGTTTLNLVQEETVVAAAAWPTTPNLAGVPNMGAGWSGVATPTATTAYTHAAGDTGVLDYPATITSGQSYQIVFSRTLTAPSVNFTGTLFTLFFRNGGTVTTGQQQIWIGRPADRTLMVTATADYTDFVVVPNTLWGGSFTLSRIAAGGPMNSQTFSLDGIPVLVRGTSLALGTGARFMTNAVANNVAIGPNALTANTTGINNVAIGANALSGTIDNSNNIAIGLNAAAINNQAGNVAIGNAALQAAANASTTVAVGTNAGSYILGGSANIAIGASAISGTSDGGPNPPDTSYYTTGSDNVCIGGTTGYNLTVGNTNVSVGRYAGMNNSTGSDNICLGDSCLGYGGPPPVGVVNNNVLMGKQTFQSVTTGDNNVAIGYAIAASGSNVGSNNVALGASASLNASANNQIVIGSGAISGGANTVTLGNSSIVTLRCNVQTISTLSDVRVKEEIQAADLTKCLDAVRKLPVHRWAWGELAGAKRDRHVTGFMADEVERVFPKAVTASDESLTRHGPDGAAVMRTETVTEDVNEMDPDTGVWRKTGSREVKREVEDRVELSDVKRVTPTELLPTLWGAVQALAAEIERLKGQGSPAAAEVAPAEEKPPEPPKPVSEPPRPAHGRHAPPHKGTRR